MPADVVGDLQRDLVRRTPAHRQPRVGRGKAERLALAHQRDRMVLAERLAQLVGRAHPAQSRTHYDDPGHGHAPVVRRSGRASIAPSPLAALIPVNGPEAA